MRNKGPVLLDEITEMPTSVQSKLLQVLQNKQFFRPGSGAAVDVDVRILAASSANIERALSEKKLREDLYYRLSAFTVQAPPLRQRKDEIPLLLRHFMHHLAKHYDMAPRTFSPAVLDACHAYSWPGNLRELEEFVKRYLVMGDKELSFGAQKSEHASEQRPARAQNSQPDMADLDGNDERKRRAPFQSQLTQVTGAKCSVRSGKKRNCHGSRENRLEPKSRSAVADGQLSNLAVQDRAIPHELLGSPSVRIFQETAPGAMESGFSHQMRTRALQLLSLEQTMTITVRKMCWQRAVMFVICMLISGCLAAQTDAAKNTNGRPNRKRRQLPPTPILALLQSRPTMTLTSSASTTFLSINVWKEPEVSRTVPVRSDGKISLPLAGEVQASGETPIQLEKALAAKLQSFISEPEVTVIVTEIKSQKFNILGMVTKPGTYPADKLL